MQVRRVVRSDRFDRNLRSLTKKKYPDLEKTVQTFLTNCGNNGVPATSHKIPGVGNNVVFKSRLPLRGMGKRQGARIIYFCDEERVVALFVYAKNLLSDIPVNEIKTALKESGLLASYGSPASRTALGACAVGCFGWTDRRFAGNETSGCLL